MTITIGQKLKAAREEQRLTLEKVFEATRIRIQYLQALEEDDLSVMPSPVQARGYLRNYAEFLGFDVTKLLDEQREASLQKPVELVIGPTDVPEVQQMPGPEAEPSVQEPYTAEDTTPLIKPKPARRKKADSQPGTEPTTPPKRRSRKKPELDPELVAELAVQQEAFNVVEEPVWVDEPVVQEPEPEKPVIEEAPQAEVEPEPAPETQTEPEVSDRNWQNWLTRLGAILAARNRRQTLVVKETTSTESPFVEDNPSPLPDEPPRLEESSFETGNAESSTQIFKEIGRELRERRELLSLHLEEVERNTHVKAHYLDALERGAIDDLPSTVQTRGMLSNYATFLDLDVDTILLRFADALQARYRERNPQKPVRKPGQPITGNLPPMRSFIAGDLIFGVGIVFLLVGFAIWGVSRVLTLQSQQTVESTAPSISEILLASPEAPAVTGTATERPIEAFPGQPTITVVIPTLNENVNVQVNLVAAERTFMRVIADGEVVFEGRVLPGTAYPFEAEEQIEVLVGNGAAIRIVYNGQDLGLLGSFGQVVNNIYMANEIVTPTGMPTATSTIPLTPTRTEVPSATPPVSATPAPSGTAVP
jgi:cytoskeletal protein RodZ